MMRRAAIAAVLLFITAAAGFGADEPQTKPKDDPIAKMRDATMAFFRPLSGTVKQVNGRSVVIADTGSGTVLKGMRLKVLREGAPFIHPVTKEVVGKVETAVGTVEVRDTAGMVSAALVDGETREGDKARIAETKIRMLFIQDKSIDWYLADALYRSLKGTGRIEMADSGLESDDTAKVLEEAKRLSAEVAIVLTARETDKTTTVRQRLYWVSDGALFYDAETPIDAGFVKDLKVGEEFFSPRIGEVMMTFDLPFSARYVAYGDIDGDRKSEIILSNGKDIRVYASGVDLKLLWEIKGSVLDDHVWLDTIDLKRSGRDALVLTSLKGSGVTSAVYEFSGSGFSKVWETSHFLRRLGSGLIAQAYTEGEGFSGPVMPVVVEGSGFSLGKALSLPKGVNIYDFVLLEGAAGEQHVFAYDEEGFVNLYDAKGIRLWRSAAGNGGFITTYKKSSTVSYVDSGVWSIKDRLVQRGRSVMVIRRVALADMAKTFGFKNSVIRDYWWNGVSMEEAPVIEGIKGSALDYAVSGDRVAVLGSPMFGVKFDNILKGENPLGTVLYIYSLKGR